MLEFVLGYSAGQRGASRAASLARSTAVGDATIHTNRVEDLNERIEAMALIMRAMWALLEDQGLTAEQLRAKIQELDQADGNLDGRLRRVPVDCPSCQSKVAPGLSRCQFCGTEIVAPEAHPLSGF